MSEHTPLPWKRDGQFIVGSESVHINGRQRNRLGYSSASYSDIVCEIYGNLELPAPLANADLIFTACTSHEALVEALTSLLLETEDYLKINNLSGFYNHSLVKARKALALAEVKP